MSLSGGVCVPESAKSAIIFSLATATTATAASVTTTTAASVTANTAASVAATAATTSVAAAVSARSIAAAEVERGFIFGASSGSSSVLPWSAAAGEHGRSTLGEASFVVFCGSSLASKWTTASESAILFGRTGFASRSRLPREATLGEARVRSLLFGLSLPLLGALSLLLLVIGEVLSGFLTTSVSDPRVFAILITRCLVRARGLLLLHHGKRLLVSLLGGLLHGDFDLHLLQFFARVLKNGRLELARQLSDELLASLLQLVLAFGHHLAHLECEGILGTREVPLRCKLFCVAVFHRFLDLLELFLAVLRAVLLHRDLLFFFDGARPDLDVVDLFGLVELEGLTVSLQNVGVEGHD